MKHLQPLALSAFGGASLFYGYVFAAPAWGCMAVLCFLLTGYVLRDEQGDPEESGDDGA